MTSPPDIPLTPEASDLLARIGPRIQTRLAEVGRVPVAVLLWGPGASSISPLAAVRLELRKLLREKGHAACYSEELCDPTVAASVRMQQLAQAQEFDLVVSMPCTPGSIGEIHDFVADRRVNSKTLIFLNREHLNGYSAQSLNALETVVTCQIEYYPSDSDTAAIVAVTMDNVQRIREMKYLLAGRC